MKYIKSLLEFAILADQLKGLTGDEIIDSHINKKFENDTRIIFDVFVEKYEQRIIIKWNHNEDHSIVERIEETNSFKSISHFNNFFDDAINDLFNNHINEIEKTHRLLRYGLFFNERKISIILEIDYNKLFHKFGHMYAVTVTNSTPDADITIIMDDKKY